MMSMKKRGLVFFAILTIISFIYPSYVVSAAEIIIGSKKYPSFILIPIISIIVCSIILVAVLVSIAKKRIGPLKKNRPFFIFGKAAKERRHENIYLKDIKKFKKELNSIGNEEAFNMLSSITKNFFKELLDLHYEFTYDELERELRKRNKRKELIDVCHELTELKYSGRRITKRELEAFADMVQELIKKEEVKKEESELKVSKALSKEKKGFLSKLSEMQTEQDKKKHLIELMKQEEDALKKDMEIAKSIYHKILSSYYNLPAKDRKDVHEKLTNFYEQVNKMLFSSFYSKQSKRQLDYFTKQISTLQKQAEKVIAMEKIKAIQEKAAGKLLKVPELKVMEKPGKIDIRKEKALKSEELKKLEMIEKEARERIKHIGESIIEQNMLQRPEKSEERTVIKEIRYVMPHEYVVHKPVQKPSEVHVPQQPHEMPRAEHAPKQIEHVPKEHIKHIEPIKPVLTKALPENAGKHKHAEEKKHMEKYAGIKNRKIMHIAKEEQAIRERLERLGKNYIG